MSSDNKEIKKENYIVSKKERTYVFIFTVITFAFTFGILAFRLLTKWELVLRRPYTEGWTFFFWILILGFIISIFIFEKREIIVLFLSSFIALFWELLIEPFGWYFDLWPFATHLDDPVDVFYLALQLGFEFYAGYYLLGILYLFIYTSNYNYKYHVLLAISSTLTVLGWLGDLFIARFDTYLITFFIWLILNSLHLSGVILIYNFFHKEQD